MRTETTNLIFFKIKNLKCYFTYDEKTRQRVLIPGCWSVVNSNDISDCTCKKANFNEFEKQRYNEVVKKLNDEISALSKEITRLEKRVEFWHNKYLKLKK